MCAYSFLSLKFFQKNDFQKMLMSINLEKQNQARKKLIFFCILFIGVVVLLSTITVSLMYEFTTVAITFTNVIL